MGSLDTHTFIARDDTVPRTDCHISTSIVHPDRQSNYATGTIVIIIIIMVVVVILCLMEYLLARTHPPNTPQLFTIFHHPPQPPSPSPKRTPQKPTK